ncbi:MAG: hypothetical protein SFU85_08575 [Candidatus Methylacidiphilales bacterium]|nr:hypothetical protein [Candidatus Methylacidiphilales bacterium]
MPSQPPFRALGEFIQALEQEKIPLILIGMMAAVEQGAPLSTIDYDFWVDLPKRQVVRLYQVVQRLGGTLVAPTYYELRDGTQVNVVFEPTGLRSFAAEYANCRLSRLGACRIRVLPLSRVIASKEAAGREKDLSTLPVLKRTLRLQKKLAQGPKRRPLQE